MRVKYDAWAVRSSDTQWIKTQDDLPHVARLINVKDRKGTEYCLLNGSVRWEQPAPPEQERYEQERRDVWLMVNSYLVKRTHARKLCDWAIAQDFMGGSMPESHEFIHIFLREYPWSPAFKSIYTPYHSHDEWTARGQHGDRRLPCKVLVTDDAYLSESNTFDCSADENIHVKLPAKWIYDRMALRPTPDDGAFVDESDETVVVDPSVTGNGPGALLINKRALLGFLAKHGCDIVWIVVGEKGLIGERIGSSSYWPGRLELSGAFRLDARARVTGVLNSKLLPPRN